MRDLSRDMDQRQNALRKATEHLDRATTLRQDAAVAARRPGRAGQEIDQSLGQADERPSEMLSALSKRPREPDRRTADRAGTHRRIFEARLAEWRGVEQQLSHAMEQAAARQMGVTALQTEIRTLYEKIERVQTDARAVTEAQPQIATTRAALTTSSPRLDDSDGVMKTLVERRRQLDRAEERLAHADTPAHRSARRDGDPPVSEGPGDYFLSRPTAPRLRREAGRVSARDSERGTPGCRPDPGCPVGTQAAGRGGGTRQRVDRRGSDAAVRRRGVIASLVLTAPTELLAPYDR